MAEAARIARAAGVTLARLKGTSPEAAAGYIGLRGGFFCPSTEVKSFVLMSSRDSTGGGPYIIEERYPLLAQGEPAWSDEGPAHGRSCMFAAG